MIRPILPALAALVLFQSTALAADPFADPYSAFGGACLEILKTGENATAETTAQGFTVRTGNAANERKPGEDGIILKVTVAELSADIVGSEEVEGGAALRKKKVVIPSKNVSGDKRTCMRVEIIYGPSAPKEVLGLIDEGIAKVQQAGAEE